MNNKMIIIQGYLASGKSTFAVRLSESIKVPCFVKDTFKSALCTHVTVASRAESSKYSAVTFDGMMYAAERLLEVGYPVIIEGNFAPAGLKAVDEAKVIKTLMDRYACKPLVYKFMGDTRVLYDRFIQRERSPERGQANRLFVEPSFSIFDQWCRNLDPFDVGGRVVKVDTTRFEKVDFEGLTIAAQQFMDQEDKEQGIVK